MKGRKVAIFASIVAALGGLLFGFDTAVISGAEQSVQKVFELSGFWHGFTVAIALIGTVIGAMVAGEPADKYGRKRVLILIAALYSLSAIGSALAKNWYLFLVARLIGGLGVGASSVVGPAYISEISPSHLRGRLVALFQLNVTFGILAAYFSNYLVASAFANQAWRWMFGVEFFPAAIFFILLFLIPRSPRWLAKIGKKEEARQNLIKLGEQKVQQKLKEIMDSLSSDESEQEAKLFSKKYSYPIILAVLIAMFNQLSGINAIMYFAPRIFEMAGIATETALLRSVAIGATNFIFTILAMTVIDKLGRKKMLIIGSFGLVFSLGMLSKIYFLQDFSGYGVLVYLVIFIAFFAFSQGSVIWVFISEIFPNKVRGEGQALGSFTHWSFSALVSWTFPIIAENPDIGGKYAFLFFCIMMVIQLIVVWKYFPETKGRSLEQIEKDLDIE